jgi:hypothetical protein
MDLRQDQVYDLMVQLVACKRVLQIDMSAFSMIAVLVDNITLAAPTDSIHTILLCVPCLEGS